MEFDHVDEAVEHLEKANANLEPELLSLAAARQQLKTYAHAQRLVAFGVAALARRIDDASEIARATGSSTGKAKDTIATGKVLSGSAPLADALKHGRSPWTRPPRSPRPRSPHGFRHRPAQGGTRRVPPCAQRQGPQGQARGRTAPGTGGETTRARAARSYSNELGMVHVHLALEPHVGSPIVARAEAEAQRLGRKARAAGTKEPFERHLADAYAAMLSGSGKGRAKRPELVVLVSHEVAKRGWTDLREGEVCKIPGVGPVSPQVAREIAQDAFLNGVFFDGVDLRHFKRWSRDPSVEVRTALELGEPPEFDGVCCLDCGNRLRPEFDHVEPRVALGPTSHGNLKPRCYDCHQLKTERDRKAGKLKPPEP